MPGSMTWMVTLRDSKDPTGPALVFSTDAWAVLTAAVKAGVLGAGSRPGKGCAIVYDMSLRYVVIECCDPKIMGRFWQSALSLSGDDQRGYYSASQEEGGIRLLFSVIENKEQPRGIPFLRLSPDRGTVASEVARLCSLGAIIVEKIHRGWGMGEVKMSDPEGNVFIVESGLHELKGFEDLAVDDWSSGDEFWADASQRRPDVADGIASSGTPGS